VAPDRRCPQCGEPVTPFAAGCAVCGFDLEAWRREKAASPVSRVRGRVQVPRLGVDRRRDLFVVLLLFFLVAFSPLIGALISGLVAFSKNREGDITMRNVALAFLAIDVLAVWLGVALGWGLLGLFGLL
jgi:hypothetical protein